MDNINFNEQTGRYSFLSVQQPAWHGLGQIVQDYPTSAEAITYAGLDFEVEKRPLFTYDNENQAADPETELIVPELEVPDYYATVRTDTEQVLGVVGEDYHIVQNRDAFSFFDAIVGGGDGILYETAGALGKGERIFITAKLPDNIRVGNGDDVIERYLFLTTSHDGSGSIMAAFTPIRIVCQNTLNAAISQSTNKIKIRHTANAKQRLETAHHVMGISNQLSDQMGELFNRWTKIPINDRELRKLIEIAMAPNIKAIVNLQSGEADELSTMYKNMCNDVFDYAMTNGSQLMDTTKGTLFGAYNAVTGYFQNVSQYKTSEAKLKSILLGGTAYRKAQRAFDLCLGFEKGGAAVLSLR